MGFVATRVDRGGQHWCAPCGAGQISRQQILKKLLEELCREVPTTTALAAGAVCGNVHTNTGVGQAGRGQVHKLSWSSIYVCTAEEEHEKE